MPYWQGIECEGRLVGVPTLFVRNEATIPPRLLVGRPHVYLNPPNPPSWPALLDQWQLAVALLDQVPLVTVVVALLDLSQLPTVVRDRCHLVIDLPDAIDDAKADDELRFSRLDDEALALIPLSAARWTLPSNPAYAADKPLE